MVTVTLYTRVGCHLCDDAKDVLDAVKAERPFALEVVDVDTDPALVEAYGMEVPVVLVAGRKTFKYRVDPAVLRDRLERAGGFGGDDARTRAEGEEQSPPRSKERESP